MKEKLLNYRFCTEKPKRNYHRGEEGVVPYFLTYDQSVKNPEKSKLNVEWDRTRVTSRLHSRGQAPVESNPHGSSVLDIFASLG